MRNARRFPKQAFRTDRQSAFVPALGLLIWVACCGPVWGEEFELFEKKIRPVLAERCYKCHSLNAEKLKGELLLDSKEGMLKGGGSGKSSPFNFSALRLWHL